MSYWSYQAYKAVAANKHESTELSKAEFYSFFNSIFFAHFCLCWLSMPSNGQQGVRQKVCMHTQYRGITPRTHSSSPRSVKSSMLLHFQSWLRVVGGGAVLEVKLYMLICH